MKIGYRKPRSTGRRRTREEIQSILEWQRQSGLSLLAFAKKQGLCYASLLRWRGEHASPTPTAGNALDHPSRPPQAEPPPRLVPVQVETSRGSEDFALEWVPGRWLRIPAGFDPHQLGQLLDVLGVRR